MQQDQSKKTIKPGFAHKAGKLKPGTDDPDTLLHDAVCKGDIEAMRAALARGADPDKPYAGQSTLLHLAICLEYPEETVNALIPYVRNINARDNGGRTALFCATCYDHPEYIEALLLNGADPAIRDELGKRPVDAGKLLDAGCAIDVLNRTISQMGERKTKHLHRAIRGPV